LRETAQDCQKKEETQERKETEEEHMLRSRLEERRQLRKTGFRGKVIADLGKQIQMTILKIERKKQNEKIGKYWIASAV